MLKSIQNNLKWLLPLTLALLTVVLGIMITRYGVNLNGDTPTYVAYARGLSAGQGLTSPITSWGWEDLRVPLTEFPPLYSILLSFGSDSIVTARYISIIGFVASALLIYAIALLVFEQQHGWAFFAALLYITMHTVLEDGFSYGISETPFVPVCLAILYIILYSFRHESIPIWYTCTLTILLVSAIMLRYVGFGFGIFIGLVYVWHWQKRRLAFWHFGILATSALPIIVYMVYLYQATGSVTGRQTTADSLNLVDIPDTLSTTYEQLIYPFSAVLHVVGLQSTYWTFIFVIPLALLTILLLWRNKAALFQTDIVIITLYLTSYQLMFWLLSVRSDAIVGWAERHHLVLYPAIIILILYTFYKAKFPLGLSLGLAALWIATGILAIPDIQTGREFNREVYRDTVDPALQTLQADFPQDTVWYSMRGHYVGYVLGNDTPVRLFSLADYQSGLDCDELLYLDGYTHAAFVALDEFIIYDQTPDAIEVAFAEWIASCGIIVDRYFEGILGIILVRLDDAVIGS